MKNKSEMPCTYVEQVVAYIDILGFKKIVSRSENDEELLRLLLDCLEFIKGHENPNFWDIKFVEIEVSAQKKGLHSFKIDTDVKCTCFSDSIAVSVPVTSQTINSVVSTLVAKLAYMGSWLLTRRILIRGGITVGNLIHQTGGIILGQALIDAYELENTCAKYPRIIISDKLIGQMNYPIEWKKDSYPYHQYLTRYQDGCVGFSQLKFFQVIQSSVAASDQKLKNALARCRETIIDGLNHSVEHPDIFEKYDWLRNQYEKLVILEPGLKEDIKPIPENTIHYPT